MAKQPLSRELLRKNFGVKSGSEIKAIEKIPTGVIGLDYILGGGIPLGRAIEIFGPSHSFKSTTALFMYNALARTGRVGAYLDAEAVLNERDITNVGVDPHSLNLKVPTSAEDAVEYIRQSCALTAELRHESPLNEYDSMIIVDSVPALIPLAQLETIDKRLGNSEGMTSMVFKQAVFWSAVYGSIVQSQQMADMTLLFINQARKDPNPYASNGGVTTPGGDTLKYLFSFRMQSYCSGKTDENAAKIPELEHSVKVKWVVRKNKVGGRTGLSTELDYTEAGPNPYTSLIHTAAEVGIIKKGQWYKFSDEFAAKHGLEDRIGNGFVKTYEFFKNPDNKPVYDLVYNELLEDCQKRRVIKDLDNDASADGSTADAGTTDD